MAASSLPWRSSFSAFRIVPLRSNATKSGSASLKARVNHGIKQCRWPERAAMHLGVAEPRNGVKMIGRRVAFVAIKSVTRVQSVQFDHLPVARYLRHNRRGGDCRTPAVAVQHAALRHWQLWHAKRIDEDDVGKG